LLFNIDKKVISNSLITIQKKKRIISEIRKSNPILFNFNLNSSFVLEPRLFNCWYNKLSNKNNMKLSENEIILIKYEINQINELKLKDSKKSIITIGNELKNKIINAYFIETEFNEDTKRVKNIIENCEEKNKISCLKVSKLFEQKYSQKISSS